MGICNSENNHKNNNKDNKNNKNNNNSNERKKRTNNFIPDVHGIEKFHIKVEPTTKINESLQFMFRISRMRCRMLKDKHYYLVKVIFDDKEDILPLVSGSNPNFTYEKTFIKDCLYSELSTRFLEIHIYSLPHSTDIYTGEGKETLLKKSKIYAGFRVDLLTIAVGPEHHNLVLTDPCQRSEKVGRIMYVVECRQISRINVKIISSKIEINHLLQNNISLKLNYKDSQISAHTHFTEVLKPTLLNNLNQTIYDYPPINDNNNIVNNNRININVQTSMFDLRQSESAINIYSVRFPKENVNNNDISNYYNLLGYCIINFVDILSEFEKTLNKQASQFFRQVSVLNKGAAPQSSTPQPEYSEAQLFKFDLFQDISLNYDSPVYLDGIELGLCHLFVQIKNIPLMRQIMCGVMTENGFDVEGVHLYDYLFALNGEQNTLPREVEELINKKRQLNSELIKQKQIQTDNKNDFNQTILSILKEFKQILSKSVEENCFYFAYSNNTDLYTGQNVMLDLGITLINVVQKLNKDQREIIFSILKLINERAEFDIGTIALKWFKQVEINKNKTFEFKDNCLITTKLIENFLDFNYLCLSTSLDAVCRGKTADLSWRNFSEFFLPVAYFRIPAFREVILSAVRSGTGAEGESQGKKGAKRSQSIDDLISSDPINNLIMWENLFYGKLDSALNNLENNGNNNNGDVENEIGNKLKKLNAFVSARSSLNLNKLNDFNNWKKFFEERDVAFFSLIKNLLSYIYLKSEGNREINWLNLPGFEVLLSGIAHEIKVRNVRNYSKQMMELVPLFINSSEIINEYSRLIMSRTNVYDTKAVFNFLDVVSLIFHEFMVKYPGKLYTKFNYSLLNKAIKLIIQIDHSLCVSKVILFFYDYAQLIPYNHLGEVCNNAFISLFYNLFFHWSFEVRDKMFYFILFILSFRLKDLVPYMEKHEENIYQAHPNLQVPTNLTGQNLQKTFKDIIEEKLVLVKKLKEIAKEEHCDPSFNNIIRYEKYKNILNQLPKEVHKNIVVSLHHFDKIQQEYIEFVNLNSNKRPKDIEYPELILVTPKDDNVEYD